jgi:predicted nucleic acid-binding protein
VTVVAVYDANVLYPSLLRDLLIRIAIAGAVRAHWSEQILDEVFRNLRVNRPDLDVGALDRTRTLMNDAIRDVRVTGFDYLIDELELPDPDDRHVLATAIHARASVIVTANVRDFPADDLVPHGVTAQHPDAFLAERFDDDPVAVVDAVRQISIASRRPHLTVTEIIDRLNASDLPMLAERMRSTL